MSRPRAAPTSPALHSARGQASLMMLDDGAPLDIRLQPRTATSTPLATHLTYSIKCGPWRSRALRYREWGTSEVASCRAAIYAPGS
jgi:hypothetical protein